jgi:peptide/nickel transport system substrate-binding protein
VSGWEREIDSLFVAGVKEQDESKRKVIYGRFQQIVAQQLPVFFLVNPLSLQAVRDRVQNLKVSAQEGAFWNIEELRVTDQ